MNAPLDLELSPAQAWARALVKRHGKRAPDVLETELARRSNLELAALLRSWREWWARSKQLAPPHPWRSLGFLTGRGFGKTRAISEWVNGEVAAGRSRWIGLIAQNEDKTFEVMVDGPSGLIATSPPWFRARWVRNRVLWPNGAQAFVFTPERPGELRGPEHDLAWASELSEWPAAKRAEAWKNLRFGVRRKGARLVWDSNSQRRHPILRFLLNRAAKDPEQHIVRRGHTLENADNLNPDALAELLEEFGGTRAGAEELGGEFFDEDDGALWRAEWIEKTRRERPSRLARSILSLDPAISLRPGTDATGMVGLGLDAQGQVYVFDDLSRRRSPEQWGAAAIAYYLANECDCIVAERNRGGDLVASNIRAAAKDHDPPLTVVVIDEKAPAPTRHQARMVVVRELVARGSKRARAEPVATLYERGGVSHCFGYDHEALEEELTTWEPVQGAESPNRLDAVVHGVWELAKLGHGKADPKRAFAGLQAAQKRLEQAQRSASRGSGIAALLGRGRRGGAL